MDAVAKERKVLAKVLDRCVADLEIRQREQLRRHRLLVEELIHQELDTFHRKEQPILENGRHCYSEVEGEPKATAANGEENRQDLVVHAIYAAEDPEEKSIDHAVSERRRRRRSYGSNNLTQIGLRPAAVKKKISRPAFFTHSAGYVHGTFFNLLSALLIVGNAVFIGIQPQDQLQHALQPDVDSQVDWRAWEHAFLVLFILELAARILNDKWSFLRGVEWRWNTFDSIIVGVSIIETVAESILSKIGVSFPFLRLVRVVRVLRVLKVLHMVPFFRRLGLMMTSVSASLSALAPAFVLLVLLIYLFGICIMQGIINYVDDDPLSELGVRIEYRFGSVGTTMKTLFMSVTSGLSWIECLEILEAVGPLYDMIFLFYIGFVQICVLNIVTGVFVDTVHQMYRPEREEMVQREISKRKQVLKLIRNIFEDADEDSSGTITWEEFEDCMSDEQILMYLSSLEIDIKQASEIFEIIDSECKHEVGIDEVVIGFLEMKGAAKGADVVILRNNVTKLSQKFSSFKTETARTLEKLRESVEMSRRDLFIVGGGLDTFSLTKQLDASNAVECPPPSAWDDGDSLREI